jgi:ribosome biogenesis GTPase
MQGRIIKGIAGFYYVYCDDRKVYECKAKGIFRKDRKKPMVGDIVDIEVLKDEDLTGNINELLPRKSELIRPAVANADQALIVFALTHPEPNYLLLDKLLLQFRLQDLPVLLCFNKEDLVKEEETRRVRDIYKDSGSRLFFTCATSNQGLDELRDELRGRLTCLAGPSGVGKSSLTNCLQESVVAATGDISRKAERGRHTTRHSEIIPIDQDTFIMDTPGFSSFDVTSVTCDEIGDYYNEFAQYTDCRFKPCSHTHEPDCAVKEATGRGLISAERYNNYTMIYNEIKSLRRY